MREKSIATTAKRSPSGKECPAPIGYQSWPDYWRAQGMKWRTDPEIDEERRLFLVERRAIEMDVAKGVYPFMGIALTRADVEWLLATHRRGRGPINWEEECLRPAAKRRRGLDLRGADLRNVDLHGLPLACMIGGLSVSEAGGQDVGAHFERANLQMTQLGGALLASAHFEGASLQDAQLEGAYLFGTHLELADLRGARLDRAELWYVHLEKANLTGVSLTGALVYGSHLEGAVLAGMRLENTRLSHVHLEGADVDLSQLFQASRNGAFLDAEQMAQIERGLIPCARCHRMFLLKQLFTTTYGTRGYRAHCAPGYYCYECAFGHEPEPNHRAGAMYDDQPLVSCQRCKGAFFRFELMHPFVATSRRKNWYCWQCLRKVEIESPCCWQCHKPVKSRRELRTLFEFGFPRTFIRHHTGEYCDACVESIIEGLLSVCELCGTRFRVYHPSHHPHALCPDCRMQHQETQMAREQVRVRDHVERARKEGCAATLTIEQWIVTLNHFRWRCAYCQSQPFEVLEHITSLSRGGGTTADNCVPACLTCNSTKDSMVWKSGYEKVLPHLSAKTIAQVRVQLAELQAKAP